MIEYTAIIYIMKEYETSIFGSKHPTVLITDQTLIVFLFTQESNPSQLG